MSEKKYILSIDSGSTGIRALLFDKAGEIIDREYEKTTALTPEPGAIEHEPEKLWEALLSVVNKVLDKPEFNPDEVAAIGITNQRASFCLWDKNTGKPLVNFINWGDTRAADTKDEMRNNKKWRMLKKVAGLISGISPMMAVMKLLQFETPHGSVRLKWLLDKNPEIREKCKSGNVMFGTLDTWFIYKLTGGLHLTDSSNAAGSSLYNPFNLAWNTILCGIFDIPAKIFPEVRDSNGDFGKTAKNLFGGAEIPIRGVAGDQSAALFGQCCFNIGDIKISQGSGAFVDILVGDKPKYSPRGLYPLIAWSMDGEITYMLEGSVQTAGTLIDWLGEGLGLSDTPQVLNELASRTEDTEGVIVIPTPAGVTFPFFEPRLKASILGLSLSTKRRHVGRAVLEGIALRLIDIIEGMEEDTDTKINSIKVDGGVSKSDIILQIIADLANITVKRAPEPDMTGTGAAYIAGLAVGFWKDRNELISFQKGYMEFTPKMSQEKREMKIKRWKKAVKAIIDLG